MGAASLADGARPLLPCFIWFRVSRMPERRPGFAPAAHLCVRAVAGLPVIPNTARASGRDGWRMPRVIAARARASYWAVRQGRTFAKMARRRVNIAVMPTAPRGPPADSRVVEIRTRPIRISMRVGGGRRPAKVPWVCKWGGYWGAVACGLIYLLGFVRDSTGPYRRPYIRR